MNKILHFYSIYIIYVQLAFHNIITYLQTPGNPGGLTMITNILFGSGLDPSWTVILGPNQTTPVGQALRLYHLILILMVFLVTQYEVSSSLVY